MKKIYIATASAAMLLVAASCTETYDILPSEYASVVRIKDGGVKDVTVYSIMDETVYPITIMKGGHDPKSAANVTLHVMDQEEFDAYLLESGAGYSLVPADCYSFEGGEDTSVSVEIPSGESFEIVNLVMNVSAIGDYLDSYTDVARDPVIPIVLEIAEGSVDYESYQMFIIPHYSVPVLGFTNLEEGGIINIADGVDAASLRIGFDGMDSPWDVTCTVEVDPTILDEYNSENHASLGLMPADAYGNLGNIILEKGASYVPLNIEIDLEKSGFRTAIPVRITSVDIDGLKITDNKVLIVTDNASKYKLNLVAEDYWSPDDASLNTTCTGLNGVGRDGSGSAALCDGIYNQWSVFWSSCYFAGHHYDEIYNSYIEIDLHKSTTMVGFDYSTRAYYNNRPYHMRVWAWNGSEWKMIGKDMDDFREAYVSFKPEGGWTYEVSPIGAMVADFEFSKVRFSCVVGDTNRELSGVIPQHSTHKWECGELVVYAK